MKFAALVATALAAVASAVPSGRSSSPFENISIRVGVETNQPNAVEQTVDCGALGADWALCGISYLRLTNDGAAVTEKNWSLFFHSIRRILQVDDDTLDLTFITGDLYKLTPNDKFTELPQGTLEIKMVYEYWMIFHSDFIPRYWFVVDDDPSTAFTVPNTDVSSNQLSYVDVISGDNWRRTPTSVLPKAHLKTRFEKQQGDKLVDYSTIEAEILPKPLETRVLGGHASLAKGIKITASGLKAVNVNAVYARLSSFGISKSDNGYPVAVSVSKDLPDEAAKKEGYTLKVGVDKAVVVGFDAAGAFYGLQSLASLVKVGASTIPAVEVVDAPYFPERRQHIDVGRNFHSKSFILRVIDQMAAYKMNMFHFHLSDDEGWRVEIDGLPELTEVGAKRCHDLTETKCLLPLLGSGPTTNNFGSGYFTREDYIEIVKYANNRFIEVFPEFDMPGHCRAAVVSMEARYRKFAEQGETEKAEEFRLMDPDDTSEFLTVQFYGVDSQINTCMPGSLKFVRKVVEEMVKMHKEAGQPLKKWHFGADEAHNILLGGGYADKSLPAEETAGKGLVDASAMTEPFARSPVCQKFLVEKGLEDPSQLIGYLAVEISKILVENGIDTFMAWQDGMTPVNASQLATERSVLNFWDTLFWGGAEGWMNWVQKGYQLALSLPDFLYFDFPYENNVYESGYYWAGRDQSVYHLFTFAPINLAQNAETTLDRDGFAYSAKSPEIPSGTKPEDHIVAISGQLWSEIVRTDGLAEYMIFPRLLALAERAWHKASWEAEYVAGREYNQNTTFVDKDALAADWTRFSNVVGQREMAKMDARGVAFRTPVPGATIEDGKLKTNIDLPGVSIFCSTDGKDFTVVDGDLDVTPGTTYYLAAGINTNKMSRRESIKA